MRYYYYLFYKFYKFGEFVKSLFPYTTVGLLFITTLELLLLVSLFSYGGYLFNFDLDFYSIQFLAPLVILFVINVICFSIDEKWKNYAAEFEKWPKEKNEKGTWIVIGIIIFVIANVAISTYINPLYKGVK